MAADHLFSRRSWGARSSAIGKAEMTLGSAGLAARATASVGVDSVEAEDQSKDASRLHLLRWRRRGRGNYGKSPLPVEQKDH